MFDSAFPTAVEPRTEIVLEVSHSSGLPHNGKMLFALVPHSHVPQSFTLPFSMLRTSYERCSSSSRLNVSSKQPPSSNTSTMSGITHELWSPALLPLLISGILLRQLLLLLLLLPLLFQLRRIRVMPVRFSPGSSSALRLGATDFCRAEFKLFLS